MCWFFLLKCLGENQEKLGKILGNQGKIREFNAIKKVGTLITTFIELHNDETQCFTCRGSGDFIVDSSEMECIEETNAKSPPPSLVPRLHAIVCQKLEHSNPHLPLNVNAQHSKEGNGVDSVLKELKRYTLHSIDVNFSSVIFQR